MDIFRSALLRIEKKTPKISKYVEGKMFLLVLKMRNNFPVKVYFSGPGNAYISTYHVLALLVNFLSLNKMPGTCNIKERFIWLMGSGFCP